MNSSMPQIVDLLGLFFLSLVSWELQNVCVCACVCVCMCVCVCVCV